MDRNYLSRVGLGLSLVLGSCYLTGCETFKRENSEVVLYKYGNLYNEGCGGVREALSEIPFLDEIGVRDFTFKKKVKKESDKD